MTTITAPLLDITSCGSPRPRYAVGIAERIETPEPWQGEFAGLLLSIAMAVTSGEAEETWEPPVIRDRWLHRFLRFVLTGKEHGLPTDSILRLLGPRKVMARLELFANRMIEAKP